MNDRIIICFYSIVLFVTGWSRGNAGQTQDNRRRQRTPSDSDISMDEDQLSQYITSSYNIAIYDLQNFANFVAF